MQAAEAGAGASLGSRAPLLVCRVGVVYKGGRVLYLQTLDVFE